MGNQPCNGAKNHNGNKSVRCASRDCNVTVCEGDGCGKLDSSKRFICTMCHLSEKGRAGSKTSF